mmetsp:Transcript_42526/g.101219  ORF Transcript_42526/g.101219 Transcript_42526/m.101219 type:complete len:270 (+) Transcript_42526:277-1086(+)|eukprot:CAMPEP_0180145116 /NCGR_PEP_ID=MMETSP0986-20121125/17445_1 /TAXON_ID=697907 /ORGANISM="non described non described, Strain CCMP2293" /LENGTH=269 /DNA_ID=CAMNT_0022089365 /DNA_START=289 /DNA_END=1098 /DNA_ORIENTATION=+
MRGGVPLLKLVLASRCTRTTQLQSSNISNTLKTSNASNSSNGSDSSYSLNSSSSRKLLNSSSGSTARMAPPAPKALERFFRGPQQPQRLERLVVGGIELQRAPHASKSLVSSPLLPLETTSSPPPMNLPATKTRGTERPPVMPSMMSWISDPSARVSSSTTSYLTPVASRTFLALRQKGHDDLLNTITLLEEIWLWTISSRLPPLADMALTPETVEPRGRTDEPLSEESAERETGEAKASAAVCGAGPDLQRAGRAKAKIATTPRMELV